MRLRKQTRKRSGVAYLEAAFVIMVFMTMVGGMIDVGRGVIRYNMVSEAARQGARQATVHGSLATTLGQWGPTSSTYPGNGSGAGTGTGMPGHEYTVTTDQSEGIPNAIRPYLADVVASTVTVRVTWLDGDNVGPDHRVQVTVTCPYNAMTLFGRSFNVSATSTLTIAH